MRYGIATALGLMLMAGFPACTRAENLLEVYAQARAADPVLAAAQSQRGVQQELATQARAGLLPQWSLSLSRSRAQTDGSDTRLAQSSLSQVLLDLSQMRSLEAENQLVSAQDARLRAAEQALCARVAQAYFGVLSAQAALGTARANEDAFAQQVAQAQKRYDAGLSAQIDVEQARAYHELSRGATVQAQQVLDDAREALSQITGQRHAELQPLLADLPAQVPQPQDAQAWVARALERHPDLLAEQAQLAASQSRIAAASAGHLPTLSLALDTQRPSGSAVSAINAGRSASTVAVQLSIPLFAGGAVESQKRQAVHQRDIQRDSLESARRALIRETQAQYQAVLAGIALMRSSGAAVAAADRSLAATRTGQSLGTRSMTDLLLAIQTQAQAQNAHEQARHSYVLATLLLQQAVGALSEAELAAVNTWLQAPTMPNRTGRT